MTSIWYEILPVTLELNHVVMLRRREDGDAPSWLVKHQSGTRIWLAGNARNEASKTSRIPVGVCN
jgi:hypothetical protein